jgi:hypothetical protein
MAKSVVTQMSTHRLYVVPAYEHRTTAKASRYCDRDGSRSSRPSALQDCQSAQMKATAPGSSGARSTSAGRRARTRSTSVRYSTVSRVPE